MNQNNSNATTANSKNSENDTSTSRGNLRQDSASSNSTQNSKFTVCKTDANHKTIFEKEANDIAIS